jgi:hypothetical protein
MISLFEFLFHVIRRVLTCTSCLLNSSLIIKFSNIFIGVKNVQFYKDKTQCNGICLTL